MSARIESGSAGPVDHHPVAGGSVGAAPSVQPSGQGTPPPLLAHLGPRGTSPDGKNQSAARIQANQYPVSAEDVTQHNGLTDEVRVRVLRELRKRGIDMPESDDLRRPFYELVIDQLLTPNWDEQRLETAARVMRQLRENTPLCKALAAGTPVMEDPVIADLVCQVPLLRREIESRPWCIVYGELGQGTHAADRSIIIDALTITHEDHIVSELLRRIPIDFDPDTFIQDPEAYIAEEGYVGFAEIPATVEDLPLFAGARRAISINLAQKGIEHWGTPLPPNVGNEMLASGRFRLILAARRNPSGRLEIVPVAMYALGEPGVFERVQLDPRDCRTDHFRSVHQKELDIIPLTESDGGIHPCGYKNRLGWLYPPIDSVVNGCLVVSKLLIIPTYGRGLHGMGEEILIHASKEAIARGKARLRLDVNGKNSRLRRYYREKGFRWKLSKRVLETTPTGRAKAAFTVMDRPTAPFAQSFDGIFTINGEVASRWRERMIVPPLGEEDAWELGTEGDWISRFLPEPWQPDAEEEKGKLFADDAFDPELLRRIAHTAEALFHATDNVLEHGEEANVLYRKLIALVLQRPNEFASMLSRQAALARYMTTLDTLHGNRIAQSSEPIGRQLRRYPPSLRGLGLTIGEVKRPYRS